MIKLKNLSQFLTDLLYYDNKIDVNKIDQKNANGLQIKGSKKIQKIAFGVSASTQLFKMTKEANCEALITHHGIRMPDTPHYDKVFQQRLSFLLKNNISLFGYHFLLDSHPEIGNNALILNSLKAEQKGSLLQWGYWGELEKPIELETTNNKCSKLFKQDCLVYKNNNRKVKRVGAVSGHGVVSGKDLQQLVDLDIDAYITGSISESSRELYREAGINLISGGHYATERLGVLKLSAKVKEEFGDKVEVKFIELWNKV